MRATIVNPSANTSVSHHADKLVSGATDLAVQALPLAVILAIFYVVKQSIPAVDSFVAGNLQARTPSNLGQPLATESDLAQLVSSQQSTDQGLAAAIAGLQQSVSGTVSSVTGTGTTTSTSSCGSYTPVSGPPAGAVNVGPGNGIYKNPDGSYTIHNNSANQWQHVPAECIGQAAALAPGY
jgi:hypothetical protein